MMDVSDVIFFTVLGFVALVGGYLYVHMNKPKKTKKEAE